MNVKCGIIHLMPLISIIIPVYNAETYLRQCIDSVLGQTFHNIEVICVNDGSTDGSAALLDEFAVRDARVRVLSQANAGQGAARNAGLTAAHGEFVAFLDADDLYPDSSVLADLAAAAARSGADVCGGSLEELLPNGAVNTKFTGLAAACTFEKEGHIDFRDYAYDYGFYRFIYRLDFLRRHGIVFPSYRRFQDPPFMVEALAAAGSFHAIPRATYRYRVEMRKTDWRADGMRKARDLFMGLADVAAAAVRLKLPHLAETVLFQACEQHAEVLLDEEVTHVCAGEVAGLCKAFDEKDLHHLLSRDYQGRTPLLYRRAKCCFRQHGGAVFRCCRFALDVFRHGMPYAIGRFKGHAL